MNDMTKVTSDLIWAYSGALPSSGTGSNYFLTHHFAWLMLQGHGKLTFESGRQVEIYPGMWYLLSPSMARSQRFSADTSLLSVRFCFEMPDGRSPLALGDCVSLSSDEFPAFTQEAIRLVQLTKGYLDGPLHDGITRIAGIERQISTNASFLNWLSLLLNALEQKNIYPLQPEKVDIRLCKMMNCLNDISVFSPVPYQQLSKLSFLGRVQIDRLFKDGIGLSPWQYLTRNLLARCKERVVFSDLLLKELAEEFKFSSTSQFCIWFRNNTGMTPVKFRDMERANLHIK